MTPDPGIVRKVKQVNPELFIRWNARRSFFELWRKPQFRNPQLITPITESIYDGEKPLKFVPLDERLLWWIYDADTYNKGGSKRAVLEGDRRWREMQIKMDRKRIADYRERAKDVWYHTHSHYLTKDKPTNSRYPTFNNYEKQPWIAPDSQSVASPRLFNRTRQNALRYNYKRG